MKFHSAIATLCLIAVCLPYACAGSDGDAANDNFPGVMPLVAEHLSVAELDKLRLMARPLWGNSAASKALNIAAMVKQVCACYTRGSLSTVTIFLKNSNMKRVGCMKAVNDAQTNFYYNGPISIEAMLTIDSEDDLSLFGKNKVFGWTLSHLVINVRPSPFFEPDSVVARKKFLDALNNVGAKKVTIRPSPYEHGVYWHIDTKVITDILKVLPATIELLSLPSLGLGGFSTDPITRATFAESFERFTCLKSLHIALSKKLMDQMVLDVWAQLPLETLNLMSSVSFGDHSFGTFLTVKELTISIDNISLDSYELIPRLLPPHLTSLELDENQFIEQNLDRLIGQLQRIQSLRRVVIAGEKKSLYERKAHNNLELSTEDLLVRRYSQY